MTELKRVPLKYVRDFIKKHYKLKDRCYICSSEEDLELHHLYSLSDLFHSWCHQTHIRIEEVDSVRQIEKLRIDFYNQRSNELGNSNLYTLCKRHHERLHLFYGQRYSNHLVDKVRNWIETQREKHA